MESLCLNLARKVALAGLICTFAFCETSLAPPFPATLAVLVFELILCRLHAGGSMVGLVSGALKGQTTETGILRGAGIGAIAGALVSVDFLESCLRGEVLPKVRNEDTDLLFIMKTISFLSILSDSFA